ncbi:hypothetical protein MMC27_004133 [Xylographa pallens]|nr:hypothetical protein [Xylographa pallens]
MADDVKDFRVGDRVAADALELCGYCYYCRRGKDLLCENMNGHGVFNLDGGFAEYASYAKGRLFKINNISDLDATLLEPAACAMQGIERIAPKPGSHALLIGCGPTGLMMAQFLFCFLIIKSQASLTCLRRKHSGVSHLTVAALEGSRMDVAKDLDVANVYVPLSRDEMIATPQWAQIKKENPKGFDIGSYVFLKWRTVGVNTKVVIEASGNSKVLENAIQYVRRGGKLLCYGVYSPSACVTWSPAQIFSNDITIFSSFSEADKFPSTIDYFESGQIKTKGIVNKIFKLEQWGEAIESIRNKSAIKAIIAFD